MHIQAHNIPDAWWQALWTIFDHGKKYTVEKGSCETQQRLEFPFISLEISNPSFRPLTPDIPPDLGIPAPTDMDYVQRYFERYLCTSQREGNEQYTYGERILVGYGRAIDLLKNTPGTNHAVIEVALPYDIWLTDPPCLRLVDLKLREGKLNMAVYFRSWDLWGGLPVNLAGLQLLKEAMATEIGCEDGAMFAASAGLHLYDHCWDIAKIRARR